LRTEDPQILGTIVKNWRPDNRDLCLPGVMHLHFEVPDRSNTT